MGFGSARRLHSLEDVCLLSPTLGVVKAWVECIIPFSFVLVSWRIVEEYVVRWRNGTLGELVRYEEAA